MSVSAYQQFAQEHARHVGGQRLFDAMSQQVNGQDQDVAEINWRALGYDTEREVYANVRADFDNRLLRFTVDERLAGSTDEFSSNISFTVRISAGVLTLERNAELLTDAELVQEALNEFIRIANPQMQGD